MHIICAEVLSIKCLRFEIHGASLRVRGGLGFRVNGFRLMVKSEGFKDHSSGSRVHGLGLRVTG